MGRERAYFPSQDHGVKKCCQVNHVHDITLQLNNNP
jgi:hypothetical protein